MKWSVTYKQAIQKDGSLLFPERLSQEFLKDALTILGSFKFANQYQNEIVPEGGTPFKKEWLKYYQSVPDKVYTFAFIDPAISQADGSDYTALTVVQTDQNKNWYLRLANRYRLTPTQIVDLVFRATEEWKPMCIGIEDVAYQKALLYMISDEMRRRGKIVPVKGINPGTDRTKEMRILGLVPRFEWGHMSIAKGMNDFELEYAQFPRGSHDDILDSLASIETIAYYPPKDKVIEPDTHPGRADYESKHIQRLLNSKRRQGTDWDQENGF